MHTDTAPIAVSKPLRYFVHLSGSLREVLPLTKPNRDNQGTVLVEVRATGRQIRVKDADLVRYRD